MSEWALQFSPVSHPLHFPLRHFGQRVGLRAAWLLSCDLCALGVIPVSNRGDILGPAVESLVIETAERRRSAAPLCKAQMWIIGGDAGSVLMRRRFRRLGMILSRPTITSSSYTETFKIPTTVKFYLFLFDWSVLLIIGLLGKYQHHLLRVLFVLFVCVERKWERVKEGERDVLVCLWRRPVIGALPLSHHGG